MVCEVVKSGVVTGSDQMLLVLADLECYPGALAGFLGVVRLVQTSEPSVTGSWVLTGQCG